MKTILSKLKKWKSKKAAADLISIIISVVLIAALVLGILLFLSNRVRSTAMDEINNTMNTITGIAEANRNNADIVIPGGPGGGNTPILPEEPEGIIHNGIIPEGGTYYVGVTSTITGNYSGATATYTEGEGFPATVNNGDVYVYGDYEYRYNWSAGYSDWDEATEQNGWGVDVVNISKNEYGEILNAINNKNVVNLDYTFYYCYKMTKAPAIPSNITSMLTTFMYCKALIEVPDLSNANNLTDMTGAFNSCTSLVDASNLIIPNSVTNMYGTFQSCTNLTKLPIIPNNVTNLSSTFRGCTSLTDISNFVIPNGVTQLYMTFQGCTGLTDASGLVIPNSVTLLDSLFRGCTNLTKVPVIPNSVTSISTMFYECTSLTEAPVIPSSVTDMSYAFWKCTSLTGEVEINGNPSYDSKDYQECFYGTTKPIKIVGSCSETTKVRLAGTANKGNVTY